MLSEYTTPRHGYLALDDFITMHLFGLTRSMRVVWQRRERRDRTE